MARAMRATDWSETSLGPIEAWPSNLQTAVDICLTSRFPMLVLWGSDHITIYNDAYAPMLGMKHPEALGKPLEVIWPEAWPTIEPMLAQVIGGGGATWSQDLRLLLNRQGSLEECYFTFSFSPIHDDDGEVAGTFCAVAETTTQVLVDRRLRTLARLASETRDARSVEEAASGAITALRDLGDDLPYGVLYLVEGDMPAVRAGHFGIAEEDAPERSALDGSHLARQVAAVVEHCEPRTLDLPHDHVPQRARNGATSRGVILPLTTAAKGEACGALVLGLNPYRPFDDEFSDFLQLVADQVAKGVIDARAAETERERASALTELNQVKTRFFSNVSHEFRTPLTLLQGPLLEALADQDSPLPEPQRRRIEMARRSADRLSKLVNALLDFSRLESGRINASYRASDLAALTRELCSLFPSAIDRAGLHYELQIETLPEQVHVDREMWEKIVFNLLSNAIKFTFEGSIAVRLRDCGDHAEFEVEDTGVGIPTDELPNLFERFHRIREPRGRSQEGTGIGLALVRELVDLHGGTIDVETQVDRGTRFTVSIPYGSEHLPADQLDAEPTLSTTAVAPEVYIDEVASWSEARVEQHARETDPGETSGARILVADDNADMRSYLARILQTHWQVELVSDGIAALDAARANPPDLVLADIIMPGLDGFELLEALRSEPELEDVPVILLSARASETSRVEGLDGGADDYLIKPFTVAELVARIRSNLRLVRQRMHTADVRARQAMLAGLSHEMQTPLAAILGSVAIVDQAEIPEPVRPALTIMRRQAAQLRGLVQQFLDFSRFESGREPVLQMTAHDPVELVASAVEVCGSDRIRIESDAELPPVRVDADRVEQILTNLCNNALKFSANEVTIGARRDGDGTVIIAVRDHGAGIPTDEHERVFDKFFRGRSGDQVEGTGLGLYISRALAEAMGGTLTLRDGEDGDGAVFELALPTA